MRNYYFLAQPCEARRPGVSLYGQVLWDPLKLIDQWDNRACAFFISLVFGLSTLSTNISANSLDAGNELAAMYPRYINIRRGQVICAFLGGWALCPWKILARFVSLPSLAVHQDF
jgi:nucleobase:cation symporter-1, NCS1 family